MQNNYFSKLVNRGDTSRHTDGCGKSRIFWAHDAIYTKILTNDNV